jgi:flap endonuclease-1
MGVNLKDLVVREEIELKDLKGRKLAFDAFNVLYQFLASIRQRDGTPLKDSEGNITSHLSGLFYRVTNFLEIGIQPVFVFDGKAPPEKFSTQETRRQIRETATAKHKEALEKGDIEAARKHAQQTMRLTGEMVAESKELLSAMGIPWVQALSEGEGQAAYMCRKGLVWAAVSQDYDSLLYGTPRLIRNLTISMRKKLPGKQAYVSVSPELIDLSKTLNKLSLDVKGLIKVAALIGTDYNKGIKGVGPKTAVKIVKNGEFDKHRPDLKIFSRIEKIFSDPAVVKDVRMDFSGPAPYKIKEILCKRHGFSEVRVDNVLKKLDKAEEERGQSELSGFF